MKYDFDTLLIIGFGVGFALIVLIALGFVFRKRIRFSLRSLMLLVFFAGSLGLLLVELFPYNPALSRAHVAMFPSPRLSPDGRYLAFCEKHHENLVLVDLESGLAIARLSAECIDFSFAPDGRRLVLIAGGFREKVTVWDPFNSHTYTLGAWLERVALSAGDTHVLAMVHQGYDPSEVRLYALDGGVLASHTFDYRFSEWSLALSADGKRAVIVSTDPRIYLWHPFSKEAPKAFDLESRALKAVLSPDGSKLVTVDSEGLYCLWDVAAETVIHRWTSGSDFSTDIRFLDNDGRLVTWDAGVQVWDGRSGSLLAALPREDVGSVVDVQWLEAAQELAVFSRDTGVFYWKWTSYPRGIGMLHLIGFWLSTAALLLLLISILLDRRTPKHEREKSPEMVNASAA